MTLAGAGLAASLFPMPTAAGGPASSPPPTTTGAATPVPRLRWVGLGHVTPEMTLRYATLASPTLRGAYDEAMGKVRKLLPVALPGRPAAPAKLDQIASRTPQDRVAHGYCSRHLSAGACPDANMCETCDNFLPIPEHLPVLRQQLADARRRGWSGEAERHRRVVAALEAHCQRLTRPARQGASD